MKPKPKAAGTGGVPGTRVGAGAQLSDRLLDGVSAVMDFLDRHLPEKFRPLVERARELLPVPEVQQPEQEQERGHTWGGMEL